MIEEIESCTIEDACEECDAEEILLTCEECEALDACEECDTKAKLIASEINAQDIFFALHEVRRYEFRRFGFTLRECQVADRLLDGESTEHIASKLYLSTSAIKYHLKHIYGKTNCKNRSEFVALMRRTMQSSLIRWY